jgi:SAM-dependent methyltransferase
LRDARTPSIETDPAPTAVAPVAAQAAVLALSPASRERLRCPVCRSTLRIDARSLACRNGACRAEFPVSRGVPILINERSSVFRPADFDGAPPELLSTDRTSIVARAKRLVPGIGDNPKARRNFERLRALLAPRANARVLVIGGGVLGRGTQGLLDDPAIDFVETDVWLGPRTQLVCDAHDIPFADGSFDAVVAQAVLEHVADPARCVAEIRRVLVPDGLVYAETPFMQQVHLGPYDFTRFTLLGHRRLFRAFDEIDAGALSGPALALIWAWENFLLCFTASTRGRNLAKAFARISAFPLKVVDPWLADRPAGLDGACAVYFLGRRSDRELSDRELIALYRGAQPRPVPEAADQA